MAANKVPVPPRNLPVPAPRELRATAETGSFVAPLRSARARVLPVLLTTGRRINLSQVGAPVLRRSAASPGPRPAAVGTASSNAFANVRSLALAETSWQYDSFPAFVPAHVRVLYFRVTSAVPQVRVEVSRSEFFTYDGHLATRLTWLIQPSPFGTSASHARACGWHWHYSQNGGYLICMQKDAQRDRAGLRSPVLLFWCSTTSLRSRPWLTRYSRFLARVVTVE